MSERSTARYSFICRRRFRSTAMWVIRWLSISSSFLTIFVVVGLLFLLVEACIITGGAGAPADDASSSSGEAPSEPTSSPHPSAFCTREASNEGSHSPASPPVVSGHDDHGSAYDESLPKWPWACCWGYTTASSAIPNNGTLLGHTQTRGRRRGEMWHGH
jgi:hypothetical protein